MNLKYLAAALFIILFPFFCFSGTVRCVARAESGIVDFFPQETEGEWNRAIEIWKGMYRDTVAFWRQYAGSKVIGLWERIRENFWEKVEEKRSILKKELEKEKETAEEKIKEETREAGENIWQKVLQFLRRK